MKINHDVDKENFESLLRWLSDDLTDAGIKFENIRSGLLRFFRIKGCHDPETYADETMNRVINRFDRLDLGTGVKPSTIFYGFANRVFLEYWRTEKNLTIQLGDRFQELVDSSDRDSLDPALDCLQGCIRTLEKRDGKLVVEYYAVRDSVGVDFRRKLAESHKMTIGALHTRIHRIKGSLRPCVEKCIESERM